jgi:TATA element modulatory factor
MAAPGKSSTRWGSFLSNAVAGMESRLDNMLTEAEEQQLQEKEKEKERQQPQAQAPMSAAAAKASSTASGKASPGKDARVRCAS